MNLSPRQLAALTIAALASLLEGCLATGPATRFYVLTPAVEPQATAVHTAAMPSGTKARVLVVKDIRLPPYLDRPQIVTRDGGNRLGWVETEQWGSPLGDDMGRILAMNLGRLLAGDRVAAAPYPVAKTPDYRIDVEIRGFERQHEGRVELSAQWWITRGADGVLVAAAEERLLGDAVPIGAPYDQLVKAMSAVYADLAKAIARGVPSGTAESL